MWILQWYIFRELFKAMLLTTFGMTLVFTLGGGVANMIKGASITSIELLQLLAFMIPVATTLTLPVAALLSTTNVYGRLSADNEFVACRASGINIHRLLLSAVVVAVGVGGFTFYFSNYVIPSFIRQIDTKARQEIDQLVNRELEMNKFIKVQDYVFHADAVQHIQGGEGDQKDYIRIAGAAFIELEGGDAVRFGTAPHAVVEFDKTQRLPQVRAQMIDVSVFDRSRLQYGQLSNQPFGPMPVPLPSKMKAKWLDLKDLFYYREVPEQLPEVQGRLKDIQQHIRERVCYDDVIQSLRDGRDWRVGNETVYVIKVGPELEYRQNPENGIPLLKNVTVLEETREGRRTYKAGSGSLRTTPGFRLAVPRIGFVLEDGVTMQQGERTVSKIKIELKSVPIPDHCVRLADEYTEQLLVDPDSVASLGQQIEDAKESLKGEIDDQVRIIIGVIHSRAAFSASCVVLIVLGAVLGIVFRGGQALVSFGLSCIPFALVIVTIIMGRQMAQNEGTETLGLIILWSGIGLVFVVDGLMLFKWLRR